jgi:hypothetical protein
VTLPAFSPDMYVGQPHAFERAGPTYPRTLCRCYKHEAHAVHHTRYEHAGAWEPSWYPAGDHEAGPHFNDRSACAVCLYRIRRVKA